MSDRANDRLRLRLIDFRYYPAAFNMALDEAIMEGIREGASPPTLRFYGWQPSAISIGVFQGLAYEVNQEACRAAGVDVVRRITGGGAVFHAYEGELTYSLLAPAEHFPANVLDSYREICASLVFALRSLGMDASFAPINDIQVDERKISGNAQTRRGGVLLQHGTILYTVDVETMFSLLNVSEEKVSDKLVKSVKKRVTCVKEHTPASMDDLIRAVREGFARSYTLELGDATPAELARAAALAEEKYGSPQWIAMR